MDNKVSSETLDQVMEGKWGTHYISLAKITQENPNTKEAQTALADAVFQKLTELGYLSA